MRGGVRNTGSYALSPCSRLLSLHNLTMTYDIIYFFCQNFFIRAAPASFYMPQRVNNNSYEKDQYKYIFISFSFSERSFLLLFGPFYWQPLLHVISGKTQLIAKDSNSNTNANRMAAMKKNYCFRKSHLVCFFFFIFFINFNYLSI